MADESKTQEENKRNIWIAVIVLLFGLLIGYIYWGTDTLGKEGDVVEEYPEAPVACTMEVLECSDGTFVGRQGPNCEFEICPDGEDLNVAIPSEPGEELVACTMDVQECPDGTFVGRQGPNCEFQECPGY